MEFLKKNKNIILYTLILIAYAVIVFVTGYHHEPWADEAQSFLHARDFSFKELIFEQLKYEGHPIVWYFFIRIILLTKLISAQVLYENLYIITCVLNIIGIYLLLFKSKIPTFIKTLLPFTFYFLYQYPIIARNHSLVFPILAIIAAFFYKDRTKHPYIYITLLVILSNISAYTFVLSGILLIFFLYDIWKENKFQIKKYIPILIAGIFFILTILYIKKPLDCTFNANIDLNKFSLENIIDTITYCYFNHIHHLIYPIQILIVSLFYILTIKIFCKNLYQVLLFLSINIPLFIILTILYSNDWHQGYAIIYIIFSMWILTIENKEETITFKKYFIFKIAVIILLLTQFFWAIKCCYFDIYSEYCASKTVAKYIKTELKDKNIVGIDFKVVAIQPYFEQNPFYNQGEYSIFFYKKGILQKRIMDIKNKKPDAIIISKHNKLLYTELTKSFKKEKEFCGFLASRGKIKEDNCFIIYEK